MPTSLERPTKTGAAFEVAINRVLITVPNVARFLVRDGNDIIIDPVEATADSEIRVFLMNSVFSALLHQRGVLPLSASCVQVGESCVAFAGFSATGKSTLVAQLQQRQFPVISDDLSALSVAPTSGAIISPGFPQIRLWANAMEHLQLNVEEHQRSRPTLPRYDIPNSYRPAQGTLPLKRIYVLRETRGKETDRIVPIINMGDRLEVLVNYTKGYQQMKGLGGRAAHLKMCASMLGSVSVFELWRPWTHSSLPQTADDLTEHLSDLQSSQPLAVSRSAA